MKPAFTLRDEHLAAFERVARESFEDRLLAHVRTAFPQRCSEIGPDETHRWIRTGIDRAADYDLRSERHASGFVRLMFLLGADFDRGQARAMLARRDVPAEMRLNGVWTMATSSGAVPAGRARVVEGAS